MEIYQTKVEDNLHHRLQVISAKLYDEHIIHKNTKYELTKFALNLIDEMFTDKTLLPMLGEE